MPVKQRKERKEEGKGGTLTTEVVGLLQDLLVPIGGGLVVDGLDPASAEILDGVPDLLKLLVRRRSDESSSSGHKSEL